MKTETSAKAPERIVSIDALRGFDMFWIIGGGLLLKNVLGAIVQPLSPDVLAQFDHCPWAGFYAWDLIMPLFLFIVGVSLPFAMSRRLIEQGNRRQIYLRILKRFILLFIIGMAVEGNLLRFNLSVLHVYCNTLQAIAVGYVVASIALLNLRVVWQGVLCAALMVAYWLLMILVPVPGHGAGHLDASVNIAYYIDLLILGRFHDGLSYTWILTSISFPATVLLGVLAGHIMKSKLAPSRKLLSLAAAGAVCTAAGLLWSIWFPIIKYLWTSSFVLFTGGLCFFLLAIFYLVIDVIGFKKWAFFFIVIGSNALFIYTLASIIETYLPKSFERAVLSLPDIFQVMVFVGMFALEWGILYAMYRKKIFLRV